MLLGDDRTSGMQHEDQGTQRGGNRRRQGSVPRSALSRDAVSVAGFVHDRPDVGDRVPVQVRLPSQPSSSERARGVLALFAKPSPVRTAAGRGSVHGTVVQTRPVDRAQPSGAAQSATAAATRLRVRGQISIRLPRRRWWRQ